MNLYRNINSEEIQFDFIYFAETTNNYIAEIEKIGGRCFKINKPGIGFKFIKDFKQIIRTNDYIAVHNHELYLNFIIYPISKNNNVKNVITHSHTTMYSDRRISAIRNRILCLSLKKQSDYYLIKSV